MNCTNVREINPDFSRWVEIRGRKKGWIGLKKKKEKYRPPWNSVYHRIFLEKSDHRVILRGDHRRTISSGLVNSRGRQKPSTKILPCFSPVLVYTSFEHVLFPRCVPLAPASPPVRCPLPTPSRGRAFNPSATLFPPPSSSPSHSRLAAYTPITFEPRECKSAQIDPKIFPSFVSTQLHLFQRSILHINRAPTFGAISYVPMIHTHIYI